MRNHLEQDRVAGYPAGAARPILRIGLHLAVIHRVRVFQALRHLLQDGIIQQIVIRPQEQEPVPLGDPERLVHRVVDPFVGLADQGDAVPVTPQDVQGAVRTRPVDDDIFDLRVSLSEHGKDRPLEGGLRIAADGDDGDGRVHFRSETKIRFFGRIVVSLGRYRRLG